MIIIGLMFLYLGYKLCLGIGYMIGAWFLILIGLFKLFYKGE